MASTGEGNALLTRCVPFEAASPCLFVADLVLFLRRLRFKRISKSSRRRAIAKSLASPSSATRWAVLSLDTSLGMPKLILPGVFLTNTCLAYSILHSRKFFDNVTPVNFTTFATPHIGLPRYPSFWSHLTHRFGPKLLSRTGEQLYCIDSWTAKGKPLLLAMADKSECFDLSTRFRPKLNRS